MAQKILPTPPKVTSIKIEAAWMSWVRLQTHTSACDVTAPRAPAASCCVWLPEHRWYCDGNRRAEPKPRRFPCVAMETNIHTSVRYWSTRLAMPLWPIKHIVSTAQRWRHRSSTSFEAEQAVDDSRYSVVTIVAYTIFPSMTNIARFLWRNRVVGWLHRGHECDE